MASISVETALGAFDKDVLDAYITAHFPAALVNAGFYQRDSAQSWLNVNTYINWATHYIQNKVSGMEEASLPPPVPMPQRSECSTLRKRVRSLSPASIVPNASSDDELPDPTVALHASKSKKRSKRRQVVEISSDSSSSSPRPPPKRRKNRKTKASRKAKETAQHSDIIEISDSEEGEKVQITRQLSVKQLVKLDSLPSTWPVPRDGEQTAYLVDLRNDNRTWPVKDGKPVSMATVIKDASQDSWGTGSSGSLAPEKCPIVLPLGVACQYAQHVCGGCYHCSELDLTLLNGCERYEPDEDEMRELFEAQCEQNVTASSNHSRAAAFYSEIANERCPAKLKDASGCEIQCEGVPVYRRWKDGNKNFDGKRGFIGCSRYRNGKRNDHRFAPIPLEIVEELVVELIQNKGVLSGENLEGLGNKCARVTSPRVGMKEKKCPFQHCNDDGNIITGTIIRRKCPTTIKIYSPVDRRDKRAIVLLCNPHNHPMFPSTKLSSKGKEKYGQAAERVVDSAQNATMVAVDIAASTREVFGGVHPADFDPALLIKRKRREVTSAAKAKDTPFGKDLEAIMKYQKDVDKNLPFNDRYIHKTTRDVVAGLDMVVTMLPELASRIHDAETTVHDNTYKRVHGNWKEWEVVIWDKKLNMRLTVARIYCDRESRVAFNHMWKELWDTVEEITGKPVCFKFLDGAGLTTILVDGCKEQVDGCGDDLVARAQKRGNMEFAQLDPRVIVQYIIRTCVVHLERKFDEMAKVLPQDEMAKIRRFRFLETEEEVEEFIAWCEASPHKIIRDWMADKKPYPWFIPSVNSFMSKIDFWDWNSAPSSTNLNESAHSYTNRHTEIGLTLLDAVKRGKMADLALLQTVKASENFAVLSNPHNTQHHRDRRNQRRREARGKAAAQKASQKTAGSASRSKKKTNNSRGKARRDYELAMSSDIYGSEDSQTETQHSPSPLIPSTMEATDIDTNSANGLEYSENDDMGLQGVPVILDASTEMSPTTAFLNSTPIRNFHLQYATIPDELATTTTPVHETTSLDPDGPVPTSQPTEIPDDHDEDTIPNDPPIPTKQQTPDDTDPSLPPHYTALRKQLSSLPQHNLSLPYPEGATGRYVKFSSQISQLGWNNVLNEVLMNAHLAYRANRAYVFMDYGWKREYYPWPEDLMFENPPRTPMAALMSGPAVGGEWPEGTKAAAGSDSVGPPRAVSEEYFNLVCPPHKRRILRTSEVKPKDRYDMLLRQGREVFDIWLNLLTDRAALDNVTLIPHIPLPLPDDDDDEDEDDAESLEKLSRQDDQVQDPPDDEDDNEDDDNEDGDTITHEGEPKKADGGNDDCLEIVPAAREEDNYPQVFDLWLWGGERVLSLWEEFKDSPVSKGLGTSPLVERCVQRNYHLFNRHLRSPDSDKTPSPPSKEILEESLEEDSSGELRKDRRQAIGIGSTVERDPFEKTFAVHIRRGDYKSACVRLAEWNSTFYSWNQLPFLPDHFIPPRYPRKKVKGKTSEANIQKYLERCLPDDAAIVKKVEDSRRDWEIEMGHLPKGGADSQTNNHYLETLFILTNERDPAYLDELKSSFGKSWKNIVISSLEIEYVDAQEKDVGMAVDMDLARRAAVFLGNGWSSFTSNILHRRLVDGKVPISNRFF
ncbi:hypothetical protein H1R20_g10478, partial [Candolleomyces eurysporus]